MLVLASRSPRRAELLKTAGFEFTVRSADIDETPRQGEGPDDYAVRIATEKASAVPWNEGETILAADTIVVLGSEIMGKPKDADDATRMLSALSGRRHDVITGVCVHHGTRTIASFFCTAVWFAPLSPEDIEWYVASGEHADKAGAYGIQGLASRFIDKIEGSWTNVVGLPIAQVYGLLKTVSENES